MGLSLSFLCPMHVLGPGIPSVCSGLIRLALVFARSSFLPLLNSSVLHLYPFELSTLRSLSHLQLVLSRSDPLLQLSFPLSWVLPASVAWVSGIHLHLLSSVSVTHLLNMHSPSFSLIEQLSDWLLSLACPLIWLLSSPLQCLTQEVQWFALSKRTPSNQISSIHSWLLTGKAKTETEGK